MAAILDLPLSALPDYLIYAVEKEKEQATWELWSGMYPHMSAGWIKHVKYDEFKKELYGAQITQIKCTIKTLEEIDSEIEGIIAGYEKRNVQRLLS